MIVYEIESAKSNIYQNSYLPSHMLDILSRLSIHLQISYAPMYSCHLSNFHPLMSRQLQKCNKLNQVNV